MSVVKIVAIALNVGGVLGLVYRGFTYTKMTHTAELGPVDLSLKERETIYVPIWAGAGAIVLGSAILLLWVRKVWSFRSTDIS